MKFKINLVILCLLVLAVEGLVSNNTTLWCYECEEKFEDERWDPYTECQAYPEITAKKPCLDTEIYCLVEKITLYGITTNIKRKCTTECYYGCRASSFGLTTMKCTSCCQYPGCNTDSSAVNLFHSWNDVIVLMTVSILTSLTR